MARPKKTAPPPEVLEPEEISQEIPEEEPIAHEPKEEPETAINPLNKSQAARAAIEAGHDSSEQAVAFIKRNFGIDMSRQQISAVKSQGKKKEDKPATKRGRKPKTTSPSVEQRVTPKPLAANGQSDLIETLKPLVASKGANRLKQLVDLLG